MTWESTHLFEFNFEDADAVSSWSASSYSTTSTAADVAEGTYAGNFAANSYAMKYLNVCQHFWVRFYLKATTTVASDVLVSLTMDAEVIKVQGAAANTVVVDGPGYTSSAIDASSYRCFEFEIDIENLSYNVYVDGTFLTTGTLTTSHVAANHITLQIGAVSGLTTSFWLDALVVDRSQVGLLDIAASSKDYFYDHDIEIDSIGFDLVATQGRFTKVPLSAFNPRLGIGAPKYSDLSGFQHQVIPSLHNGVGQPEFTDENACMMMNGIDGTDQGFIRLANALSNNSFGLGLGTPSIHDNGFICSATNEEFSLFGLAFPVQASASQRCLYVYNQTDRQDYSFTTTAGVQDILDNGSYVFVTLGGVRMQKSSRAGGITFDEGAGADSIIFDDGAGADSITFLATFVWSDAGLTAIPPTDMGQMAIYQEFVWVAERDTPWVHRFATLDASDLEGGNEDDDASYDPYAVRVGPGRIPITAMCAYRDRLYVGREDGLYSLALTGTASTDIETGLDFEVTRHRDNFRGMCTYNGYLVFQENGRIFEFNGTSKQDITPGPISDSWPYLRFKRYGGFWPHGKYLFTTATTSDDSVSQPIWYLLVFTQSGWGVLGQLDASKTKAATTPTVSQLTNGVTYLRIGQVNNSDSYVHVYEMDSNLGASGVGNTQLTGYFEGSTLDFGLPQIDRMLSLVRVNSQNIVEGTNRIKITYYLNDSGTEHVLGTIASDDCNFLLFPDETTCKKMRPKVTLETSDAANTPVVRNIVIQYMDRPETVWGYTMNIDLVEGARTYSGNTSQYSVAELKRKLEDWRDNKIPVTFREPTGDIANVFITDCKFIATDGKGAQTRFVAQVTMLTVSYVTFAPPPRGLS